MYNNTGKRSTPLLPNPDSSLTSPRVLSLGLTELTSRVRELTVRRDRGLSSNPLNYPIRRDPPNFLVPVKWWDQGLSVVILSLVHQY